MNKIAVLILLLAALPAMGKNNSAFVDAGGEVGQAILVRHAGACQAIVPTHVVGDSAFISVFGRGNQPAMGDALGVTSFGYDLSVMTVEGELASDCGPQFDSISRDVTALLAGDKRAQVNIVNPDGTVSRTPLTIIDQSLTYITVSPTYAQDKLMKGMSGSLVTVSGKPLGMLLSVDGESGAGKVIRIDRTLETVTPYFRGRPSGFTQADTAFNATTAINTSNLFTGVSRWSAPAIDGQHRASNLIAVSKEVGPWIGKIKKLPEQLVLEFGDGQKQALENILLSGQGLEGNKALARQVEILLDQTGKGRWRPLKTITLPASGDAVSVPVAGRNVSRVMLRIHNNWGDPRQIGLGRIVAISSSQ